MATKKSILHLIGKKFNRLTIINDLGTRGISRKRYCKAICECGRLTEVRVGEVKNGKIKSCGCFLTDFNKMASNSTIHGLCKHPLYTVWMDMKNRCYYQNNKFFYNYGGNGVRVYDDWRNNFKPFYDWAIANGWRRGLQLDKDKLSPNKLGKLYCPEYCCFLTRKENMRYRSNAVNFEYNGELKSASEWSELVGLKSKIIYSRIMDYGWSVEKALTTPIDEKLRRISLQQKRLNKQPT